MEWKLAELPVSDKEIEQTEKTTGLVFPQPLKELFKRANGAITNKNIFVTPDKDELVLNNILNLNKNSAYPFAKAYNDVKDRLPKNFVPFAIDPFGNLFCMGKDDGIFFWRHDNPEHQVVLLAPNLTTFFSELQNSEVA